MRQDVANYRLDSWRNWPDSRKFAVTIWLGLWLLFFALEGIPFDRATQLLMIVSAALAFSVGASLGAARVFADWIPFFAFLYGYDYSRGAADTLGFPVRVEEIYNTELALFGWAFDGLTPNVWLQQHLYDPQAVAPWESLVTLMYCSHFVVPWAIVGTLYVRNRSRWAMFARRILAISFGALVTYILVPAAPPWYAAEVGLSSEVARISWRGWEALGIPVAGQWLQLGQGVVNAVAAIPSLHAGTAFTVSLFFWPVANRWLKAFFIFYMSFMVFTLVFGGEHYVFDALLGALYAVIVEFGSRMWEKRRSVIDVSTS